jgi:hypothetical protein
MPEGSQLRLCQDCRAEVMVSPSGFRYCPSFALLAVRVAAVAIRGLPS